jgi:hypothetical protein
VIAVQAARCCDVAEGCKEDGEAYGFIAPTLTSQPVVLQDSGYVVAECKGDERCDTATDDDEVGAWILSTHGFDDERNKGEDDNPVVNAIEDCLETDEHGCEEEEEEWR